MVTYCRSFSWPNWQAMPGELDEALQNGSIISFEVYRECLRTDGHTMANIKIFSNSEDGGTSAPSTVEKSTFVSPAEMVAGYDLQPVCDSWSLDLDGQNIISQVGQLGYAKSTKHQSIRRTTRQYIIFVFIVFLS